MTPSLAGLNAVVTGGSRGIGRAIVLELARAGANVAFTYKQSAAEAEEVAALARQHGTRVIAFCCDVAAPEAGQCVVQMVEEHLGGLDILVNNAGTVRDMPLYTMSEQDWSTVLETNLGGVFRITRAAVGLICRSRVGRVITISSVAAEMGVAGQTNYCAAKAGAVGFTRALAREIGRFGATANVVAPGYIETAMVETLSDARRAQVVRQIPLQRMGRPEEVAHAVVYLGSAAASYVNGQVLVVDGGLT